MAKIDGAMAMMQDTLDNIESTQADIAFYKAAEQGKNVVAELQKMVTNEMFEDLYAEHQDQLERQEADQKLFGEVLNEDDMMAELDAMTAQHVASQMGELAPQPVIA